MILIRDTSTGVIEPRSDGSPMEFPTAFAATQFINAYYSFSTREVHEVTP